MKEKSKNPIDTLVFRNGRHGCLTLKWILFPLAAFSIALGAACIQASNRPESEFTSSPQKMEVATCYGNTPCNACTSCNYCKWCKAGGTCGICVDLKKSKSKAYKSPSSTSSQCKATTKKGSRCSRSSRSGGYCWQHGG